MTDQGELADITVYLKRLSAGDASAEDPLAEAVYHQLRRIARAVLGRRAANSSLQPTGLVNDALIELVRIRSVEWKDREHFYRVAARTLRRRLIDYIRGRQALRRPPQSLRVELDGLLIPSEDRFEEVLMVSNGIDCLAVFDSSLAELIEMIYFGGVSTAAAAEIRNVSEKTIERHLELGRRWMATQFKIICPPLSKISAYPSE